MKKVFLYLVTILMLILLMASCDSKDETVSTSSVENKTDEIVSESSIQDTSKHSKTESSDIEDNDVVDITVPESEDVENLFTVEDAFVDIDFLRPLDLQSAKDGSGRIFVVEQGGLIWVILGAEYQSRELFLDISDLVDTSGNEMGLLGLAFHPDFIDNSYFFVNYTNSTGTVIARFKAYANDADPNSMEIILSFDQPYRNHNGGQLAFGTDGYLYIAAGDGGGSGDPLGHGQDLKTYHGNILRINIDEKSSKGNYSIPEDNPFADNTEGYLEEIYAYGLRNPWRFSFDTVTNMLWAADVGQNAVEEINIIQKGKNYGWNIMEGSQCFNPRSDCDSTGLELPVYEYLHPLGRAIIGGHVYRGSELPVLEGAYLYADFITGLIWALWYREDEEPVNYLIADTNLNISSFGVDEDNELYLTAFDGRIYKMIRK